MTEIKNMSDVEILALTIYGEARGEYGHNSGGLSSFIAIANVICNRLKQPQRFGHTIKEVCLKKWQFSCWNEADQNLAILKSEKTQLDPLYIMAKQVAENVIQKKWPDLTKGSNHYFAQWLKIVPTWAKDQSCKIKIGQHLFYQI